MDLKVSQTRWLNEKDVAEVTGISISTLQKHRFLGRGIPYSKVGIKSVRYNLQDVMDFMQACKIDTNQNK